MKMRRAQILVILYRQKKFSDKKLQRIATLNVLYFFYAYFREQVTIQTSLQR